MIAGPSRQSAAYDTHECEKSLLLKNIQSGKMETPQKSAMFERSGYLSPDDVMGEFSAGFLDERACRMWILKKLHPKGAHCPKCGRELLGKRRIRYFEGKRIKCFDCEKWFTALTGTIFQGTGMDFREIVLLALFLGMNQPAGIIAGFLGGHENTIRIWRQRFEQTKVLMNR